MYSLGNNLTSVLLACLWWGCCCSPRVRVVCYCWWGLSKPPSRAFFAAGMRLSYYWCRLFRVLFMRLELLVL